ncbi:MAG: NADH-quinone oxidoreductase subunit C [Promethearchaeota archaeon]
MREELLGLQEKIRARFDFGVKHQKVVNENTLEISARDEKVVDLLSYLAKDCNARLVNQVVADLGSRLELTEVLLLNHARARVHVKIGVDARDKRAISAVDLYPSARWLEKFQSFFLGIDFASSPPPGGNAGIPWTSFAVDAVVDKSTLMLDTGIFDPKIDHRSYLWVKARQNVVHGVKCSVGHFHRGLLKMIEGTKIQDVPMILSRACWNEKYSMMLAYSLLLEQFSAGVVISEKASAWRVVAVEFERIKNHHVHLASWLHLAGELELAAKNKVLVSGIIDLMDGLFREDNNLPFVIPGGISHDPLGGGRGGSGAIDLGTIREQLKQYESGIITSLIGPVIKRGVFNRFSGMGVFEPGDVLSLGLSGPSLRANGFPFDTRVDFPYGLYRSGLLRLDTCTSLEGDVKSRVEIHAFEMLESLRIIFQALSIIEDSDPGESFSTSLGTLKGGPGEFMVVESSRGELHLHAVLDVTGTRFQSFRVQTANYLNFTGLERLVKKSSVKALPYIVHSLNPCWQCIDL